MRLLRLLLALTLLTCAGNAFARAPVNMLSPQQAAAVDAAVQAEMRKEQVVGMAIGVIQDGRVVYLHGYGEADREAHVPVTTDTLFRWASCSKSLTAVAAMQLWEHGRLALDADVRKYVPEFPDKGVVLTSRELLDHQSGIPHYHNGKLIRTQRTYPTPHPFEDVVLALDMFKESPLLFAPGEKDSYSSYAYILLSAVVQRAGREAFADQVHERIARPLGLSTLQPDYQWQSIPGRAAGYHKQGDRVVRSGNTDVSWKLGAGGFLSDIGDFAGFAAGLIDRRLVSEKTETLMWTPQTLRNGEATTDGLGFVIGDKEGRLKVSHDGLQQKTSTRFVIYPREKSGVVIMTNSEWVDPGRFSTLVYTALNAH